MYLAHVAVYDQKGPAVLAHVAAYDQKGPAVSGRDTFLEIHEPSLME